jgi:hypothetical protein
MHESEETRPPRKLKVDMMELEIAFDDASGMANSYLNLETGEVIRVTDETRDRLEELYEEIGGEGHVDEAALIEALAETNLPEWMLGDILDAHCVEVGFGTRFIRVPGADSSEGYRDMEYFIATVADARLQNRLWRSIQGRRPFRRFKDELLDIPAERERWHAFSNARLQQRILDWLADQGIEPIQD